MGRSPCCEKVGLKKGPWTPEEDQKLLAYIDEHGHGSWRALPTKAGLQRCGKSCRLRWTNYLRPDIKRGEFSSQEEQTIIQLHALLGNRWSSIATHLPKRTDNEIKNYWNTHLKKRLTKMGIDPVTHKPQKDCLSSNDSQSKNTANLSHIAQWESARLEAEARLARQSKLRSNLAMSHHKTQPAPLQSHTSPARYLDVLNAWNGISELELPTSTLGPIVGIGGCDDGMIKMENEEPWKLLPEFANGVGNSGPFSMAWEPESLGGNFTEKFTDLLQSTSANHHLSVDCILEPENATGCDILQDHNKNYWNNMLNLVDTSLSDSPRFRGVE